MLNSKIYFNNNITKSKIYILIVVGLVVALLLILFFISLIKSPQDDQSNSPKVNPQATDSITNPPSSITQTMTNDTVTLPTPISDDQVPTAPPTPIPQPGDIIIDGIAVNNFRASAARTTEQDDVILAENDEYQIVFYEEIQKFKIMIYGDNFDVSRNQAEQIFLQKLGIDEPNACRLFVDEIVPSNVNNENAGQILMLSFCSDID